MCAPGGPAGLRSSFDGIREIVREGDAYRDKSPYLYHKMLWSRCNEATTSCVSMWLLRCIWA